MTKFALLLGIVVLAGQLSFAAGDEVGRPVYNEAARSGPAFKKKARRPGSKKTKKAEKSVERARPRVEVGSHAGR